MAGNPTFRWGNFLLVQEAGDPEARLAEHAAAFPGAGFTTVGVDDAHAILDEGAWLSAGFQIERLAVLTAGRAMPRRGHRGAPAGVGRRLGGGGADRARARGRARRRRTCVFIRRRTVERRRGRRARAASSGSGSRWHGGDRRDRRDRRRGRRRRAVPGRADRRRRIGGAATRARSSPPASGPRRARSAAPCSCSSPSAAGPAIGLYRRLGFREVETQLQLSRVDAPRGLDRSTRV